MKEAEASNESARGRSDLRLRAEVSFRNSVTSALVPLFRLQGAVPPQPIISLHADPSSYAFRSCEVRLQLRGFLDVKFNWSSSAIGRARQPVCDEIWTYSLGLS